MNWEHFKTIVWLRWRLSRNQMMRGSGLGAILAGIAITGLVMGVVLILAGSTILGAVAMKKANAENLMFTWDAIALATLFIWLLGVATELQRSESISLDRLLHLPIGLKQVFVFNYLASLVSPMTIFGITFMLGMSVGLVVSHGPLFLLGLPLALIFVFMVSSWIYCLRGWLLSLMVNPRRRRMIVMYVTLAVILLGQSPQLIHFVRWRDRGTRRTTETKAASDTKEQLFKTYATQANTWVPVLWLANGERGLAAGNPLPALWGGAGMFALGWLGIGRAYRSTLKFYRGEEKIKPAKLKLDTGPGAKSNPGKAASNWVEWRLPWLPEDTAGMAAAQFRSLTRAPEVRMMLAMGLFMSIFLPALFLLKIGLKVPAISQPFAATGMVAFVLFMMQQLVSNQFGMDRDAFRGLVLLPTERKKLLLGKNLAVLPFAAGIGLVPVIAVIVIAKLSPVLVIATLLQFVAAFLLFCTVGNLASILAPYRIAVGSLKPTKQSFQSALIAMFIQLCFPILVSPIFIPPLLGWLSGKFGWAPGALVHLVAALVLAALFAFLYRLTLDPLGRLFQRREQKILRAVTEVFD